MAPSEDVQELRAPDGVRLRYTARRTGAQQVILVVPGILNHRDGPAHRALAERLSRVADVATLDVRGHGDSEGTFSWGLKEPDDVAALAASLRERYARVGGLGFSFGGFHTCVAAARHRCFDAVALVAAPARLFLLDHAFLGRGLLRSLPLMLRRRRRPTRLLPVPLGRRDVPLGVVGRIAPVPLLVAHGSRDWLVPPKHARRLHSRAGEPKELVLVEGGLHAEYMLEDDPEPLLGPLAGFFERWLSLTRAGAGGVIGPRQEGG